MLHHNLLHHFIHISIESYCQWCHFRGNIGFLAFSITSFLHSTTNSYFRRKPWNFSGQVWLCWIWLFSYDWLHKETTQQAATLCKLRKKTRQSATATQWTKDQKKLTPNKKRTAAAKINNAPNWMPQVVSVALIREFNQNFVLVSTQYFTFVISDCGFYTQYNVFKKKLCKVWPKRLAHESIIISLLFWWL